MKGISPLLAAVILVALTISIAFIASSSISTLTQRQVSTASTQGSASSNVIEISQISCGGGNVTFLVKNIGPQAISGLQVIAKDQGGTTATGSISGTFPSGGMNWTTVDLSATLSGQLTYLEVCSQNPSGICVSKSSTDLEGITCS